jgi:hypothetical protein
MVQSEDLCIGPEGHADASAGLLRARMPVDGFPDLTLDIASAPVGWACCGEFTASAPGQPATSFHILHATLYTNTHQSASPYTSTGQAISPVGVVADVHGRIDIPHPKIVAGRGDDGGPVTTALVNIDHGTPLSLVRRLIAGWNAVVSEGELGTNGPPVGRPSNTPRVTMPKRRGTAGDPKLFEKAINAYRTLEDYYDEPNETDVAQHLGMGRTTLWRALRDMGKDFAAVKMAARQSEAAE